MSDSITKQQAGRIGAAVTKAHFGVEVCPHCGQFMLSPFYKANGRKGGQKTLLVHGADYFSRIGRMGGRGRTRKKIKEESEGQ